MSEPLEDSCGLVLAAAGSGSRFGSPVPKQLLGLDGKPIYLHALEPFLEFVQEAVVVVPEGEVQDVVERLEALGETAWVAGEIAEPQEGGPAMRILE